MNKTIYVKDLELWDRFVAYADEEGISVSHAIERAMQRTIDAEPEYILKAARALLLAGMVNSLADGIKMVKRIRREKGL